MDAGFLELVRYGPSHERLQTVEGPRGARDIAANGYLVFAMDLYRGESATDPTEARKLKRNLPEARAIRDMQAVFHYLSARADVAPEYISSVGWSMGGGLALEPA